MIGTNPENKIFNRNNSINERDHDVSQLENQQNPRTILKSSLESVKKIKPVAATTRLGNSKSTERTQVMGDKSGNAASQITSEKSKRRVINLKDLEGKQVLNTAHLYTISP